MAEIKWIKITTDIFDDEKIKIIDTMPARDEVLVIWFKLLALSGKVNQSGLLFMNSKIAYTPEMLAAIFNRELNSVRLALATFENFGMITIEENELISIANWEKHQNIDGMDKIREDNRLRQQKHRAKQKALTNSNVTSNVTVTQCNAIEEDKDKEEEKKRIKDIVLYLNEKAEKHFKTSTGKTKKHINARLEEGFTVDDFKKVIDIKCSQWLSDPKWSSYLRPETLFGTKFEGYLNEDSKELKKVTPRVVPQPSWVEE